VLKTYRILQGRLEAVDGGAMSLDSAGRFWLDLLSPDFDERSRIETERGVKLPNMADLREIEATSRFFVDGGGIHLRTWFLESRGDRLAAHSVGFILSDDCLISLRSEPSASFDLLDQWRKLGSGADGPMGVFLRLVEIQLDRIADRLEGIYAEVEAHWPGGEIMGTEELQAEMGQVSRMGANNNKARFALMDLELVLAALDREETTPVPLRHRLDAVRRDAGSLLNHAGFISEKLDFLMDW